MGVQGSGLFKWFRWLMLLYYFIIQNHLSQTITLIKQKIIQNYNSYFGYL